MIRGNNAELLSQLVSNNEVRDSLILESITVQKEHESQQSLEKIQPGLDDFYAMIIKYMTEFSSGEDQSVLLN